MTTQLPQPNPAYADYLRESEEYWWNVRGQPEPPAPSYRMVGGEMVMGRYVDPYGAQGLMQNAKDRWHRWYVRFLIAAGAGVLFCGVDWVFIFLVLPIFAAWYLIKRNKFRAIYDSNYAIAQEIDRTGGPVWVPFDKDRLATIERRPQAVWP